MRYRHFFWDFDGTLFDTYGRISRAVEKALHDLGIQGELSVIYHNAKHSIKHNYDYYVQPLGIAYEAYIAAYHAHAEEEDAESMQPYAGVREILEAVVKKGGKNYLYTHRNFTGPQALENCGLKHLFADFITKEDGFPLKPAPDALCHMIQKHGLNPQECIMIGDRPIDVEAGLNARMAGALFDPEEIFSACEVPYRFRSFEEMQAALTETDE